MPNSAVAPVDTLSAERDNEYSKKEPIDVNRYATKKTVAQGMLDIALLTANASQLKYILQSGERMQFYSLLLWMISASILLQILVGVMFLVIGGLNINEKPDHRWAIILNDVILLMVFLITSINVVVSGFGLSSPWPIADFNNTSKYQ